MDRNHADPTVDAGWGDQALADETARNALMTEADSDLDDLKAMARTTKQRLSARLSSQSDVEESLLRSSSSLSAIALPDPSSAVSTNAPVVAPTLGGALPAATLPSAAMPRTTPPPLNAAPRGSVAMKLPLATASRPAVGSMPLDKPTPFWIYAVGLVVVAALGGGVYLYMNSGGSTDGHEASADFAAPTAKPIQVPDEPPAPAVVAEPEGEPGLAVDELDEPEPEPEVAVVAEPAKAKKDKRKVSKADSKAARDALANRKLVKKERKQVVDKSTGDKTVDQLLDQATNGKVIVATGPAEKKKSAAVKPDINSADVRKAMNKVRSKAMGCYNLYEKSGTVRVRFTVSASGAVTKASAKGKFAGSDTGKCVANAVRKARLPAFSTGPKSFTYPFLLSE